ncbi:MAG: BON domain-containing protein [Paraglaciecola sp.]|nr:BON domain-containing protein [Paraglaciecola sp.]
MKILPVIYVIFSLPVLLLTGCDDMNKQPTYTGLNGDKPATTAALPTDDMLEQQVNTGIQRNPLFKNGDVSVLVLDSHVTLSGQVTTPEHIVKAEEIARNVQGVKRINNRLLLSAAVTQN